MININVLIITIILGIYLVIFVTVIYPKKDQSKTDKFMPFAVLMLVMGIFYGAFIYYEYICPNTSFKTDFFPELTFGFIALLILILMLHRGGDFGGFICAMILLVIGLVAYCLLFIYISFSLTGPSNYASKNIEMLYFGLLFIPLTSISLLASRIYFKHGGFPKLLYSIFLIYSIGPTLLGIHCIIYLSSTLGLFLTIGGILGLFITGLKLISLRGERGFPNGTSFKKCPECGKSMVQGKNIYTGKEVWACPFCWLDERRRFTQKRKNKPKT